jgi:hypothetical protein
VRRDLQSADLDIEPGPGLAAYDALVGLTAVGAGLQLLTLDRRAAPVYERCGATVVVAG